jgi:hypothetical protein
MGADDIKSAAGTEAEFIDGIYRRTRRCVTANRQPFCVTTDCISPHTPGEYRDYWGTPRNGANAFSASTLVCRDIKHAAAGELTRSQMLHSAPPPTLCRGKTQCQNADEPEPPKTP